MKKVDGEKGLVVGQGADIFYYSLQCFETIICLSHNNIRFVSFCIIILNTRQNKKIYSGKMFGQGSDFLQTGKVFGQGSDILQSITRQNNK